MSDSRVNTEQEAGAALRKAYLGFLDYALLAEPAATEAVLAELNELHREYWRKAADAEWEGRDPYLVDAAEFVGRLAALVDAANKHADSVAGRAA